MKYISIKIWLYYCTEKYKITAVRKHYSREINPRKSWPWLSGCHLSPGDQVSCLKGKVPSTPVNLLLLVSLWTFALTSRRVLYKSSLIVSVCWMKLESELNFVNNWSEACETRPSKKFKAYEYPTCSSLI